MFLPHCQWEYYNGIRIIIFSIYAVQELYWIYTHIYTHTHPPLYKNLRQLSSPLWKKIGGRRLFSCANESVEKKLTPSPHPVCPGLCDGAHRSSWAGWSCAESEQCLWRDNTEQSKPWKRAAQTKDKSCSGVCLICKTVSVFVLKIFL